MGAVDAVGAVEAGEFFVVVRLQPHHGVQGEVVGDVFEQQQLAVVVVLSGGERCAVDFYHVEGEVFGIEREVFVLRQFPAVFVVARLVAHDVLAVADQDFSAVCRSNLSSWCLTVKAGGR